MPVGKMPVGKMPVGKMPDGKMPVGKMPVGKMAVCKIPLDEMSWHHFGCEKYFSKIQSFCVEINCRQRLNFLTIFLRYSYNFRNIFYDLLPVFL
jgi:hypothetical protein